MPLTALRSSSAEVSVERGAFAMTSSVGLGLNAPLLPRNTTTSSGKTARNPRPPASQTAIASPGVDAPPKAVAHAERRLHHEVDRIARTPSQVADHRR